LGIGINLLIIAKQTAGSTVIISCIVTTIMNNEIDTRACEHLALVLQTVCSTPEGNTSLQAAHLRSAYAAALVKSAVNRGGFQVSSTTDEEVKEDMQLALDLLNECWLILLDNINGSHKERILNLLPLVLLKIGDIYYHHRNELGNALDSYARALQYNEQLWEQTKQSPPCLSKLKRLRYVVSSKTLVAEILCECPDGADVVCTLTDDENGAVSNNNTSGGNALVKDKDRMSYAEELYQQASEELQELFVLYGEVVAAKIDVGSEKEKVASLIVPITHSLKEKFNCAGRSAVATDDETRRARLARFDNPDPKDMLDGIKSD
jgi:tetratricopeptide (TPR) repeat protein